MTDRQINRVLRSGPGRRQVELFEEEFIVPQPHSSGAVVRNLLTLIYPGVDLARLQHSSSQSRWIDLGCLALGRIESSFYNELAVGDLIFWNGPHADFGLLDPARHVWIKVADPDPLLLLAGIGAEASHGLLTAAGPSGAIPARSIVIGQGMLGHLAAQWLKRRGSIVTVVENSPKRLEFSKYLGLNQKIDTHNLDWRNRVQRWNPEGVDWLIDAAGYATPVADTLTFLRPGGTVCLLGLWRPDFEGGSLPADIAERVERNGQKVSGPAPTFGDSPEHQTQARDWLEMISKREIPVDRLITDRLPATDGPISIKRLAAGVKSICGVVLHWTE